MRMVVALAFALALAPVASAHLTDFSQAKALGLGPYNVIMTPKPSPMFANSALSMTAIFAHTADGTYVTEGIAPTLVLIGDDGKNATTKMTPDGTGYYVASLAVATPGNYTARIVVDAPDGQHANDTTFTVYPEIGVRFRSGDASQPDPLVGERYAIKVDTYDPATLEPKDPGADLTLTLERWNDEHTILQGVESFPMVRTGNGHWKLDHTFTAKGMYHLRFSSVAGGFKADDVPILHTYANEPATPPGGNKVGMPAPALTLGAILLGALALAFATRRR